MSSDSDVNKGLKRRKRFVKRFLSGERRRLAGNNSCSDFEEFVQAIKDKDKEKAFSLAITQADGALTYEDLIWCIEESARLSGSEGRYLQEYIEHFKESSDENK